MNKAPFRLERGGVFVIRAPKKEIMVLVLREIKGRLL